MLLKILLKVLLTYRDGVGDKEHTVVGITRDSNADPYKLRNGSLAYAPAGVWIR